MATVDDVLKLIKKYGSSWQLSQKLRDLTDKDAAALARLLWQARLDGRTDMSHGQNTLVMMPGAPALWGAADLCKLVEEMQQFYPDGKFRGGASGWVGKMPGSASGLRKMLQEKAGDAVFLKEMTARWQALPRFWGTTVAHGLVTHCGMSVDELPRDLLLEFATLALKGRGHLPDEETWRAQVPAALWGQALAEAASVPEKFHISSHEQLELLWPHATSEQRIAALGRGSVAWVSSEALRAIDREDPAWVDAQLAAHTDDTDDTRPRSLLLGLVCLRHKDAGTVVPASLDTAFRNHLDASQEYSVDESSVLAWAITQLPQARREALIIGRSQPQWELWKACPSPAVARALIDAIADSNVLFDYKLSGWTPGGGTEWPLAQFGDLLHPLATAALPGVTDGTRRATLYTIQALSGDPAYLEEHFAYVLQPKSKMKPMAMMALLKCGPDACLPRLKELLFARTKGDRMAASEVMTGLPAHEGIYALAQERLKKERVAAVKGALETVRAPASVEGAGGGLVDALVASEGAAWTEHKDAPELLDAFVAALAQVHFNVDFPSNNDMMQAFLAALTARKDDAGAIELALTLVPCLGHYGGSWLKALEDLWGDALLDAVGALFSKKKLVRPPAFGKVPPPPKPRWGRRPKPAAWDLSNVLSWVSGRAGSVAGMNACLRGLPVSKKAERSKAIARMVEHGESRLSELLAGAADSNAKLRAGAVEVLDQLRLPQSLPGLQKALAQHKTDKGLQSLVSVLSAAALDITAFPPGDKGDAAADAALAKLPAPGSLWKNSALPKLRWAGGKALSAKAQAWFVATLSQETLDNREAKLAELRPRLQDESCLALLTALREGVHESRQLEGNHAFAAGLLGDDQMVTDISRALERLVGRASGHHGRDALNGIMRRGNAAAIRGLEWARRRSGSNTMRRRCGAGLVEMAGWRGLTLNELLDSALDHFGFDSRGEQTLDYGGRSLTLKLGPENQLLIVDEKGKVRKSAPAARKSDDADVIKAAKKRISALRKELKAAQAAQRRRMEDNLACQRRWGPVEWQARFQQHPIMLAFARTLVWESLAADGSTQGTFLVTQEGELIDAEMEEFSLADSAGVRLLHPLGTSSELLDAWREVFEDVEVMPLFSQLDREVYPLADLPEKDSRLMDTLPLQTAGPFLRHTRRLGYEQGERGDGGSWYHSTRQLGAYTIRLHHAGVSTYLLDWKVEFEKIEVKRGAEAVAWRSLPPVLVSEIVRDLHQLSLGGEE